MERVDRVLGKAVEAAGWAAAEFGGAALGDARLTARLVQLAQVVGPNRAPRCRKPVGARRARSRRPTASLTMGPSSRRRWWRAM